MDIGHLQRARRPLSGASRSAGGDGDGDGDGERGSATVEIAVLLPLIMLLLMLVVQAGIYFHTRAVVTTAARKAVAVASAENGSAADGRLAASQFLHQNAATLQHPDVTVTRNGSTAKVTVSGNVASVVFGVPFSVTVAVDAPVERVTP